MNLEARADTRRAGGRRFGVAFVLASGLLWPADGLTQQQQPPPAGIAGQPGLGWTEEQIKRAVDAVRTGRKLTPRSWPNGAKVAVCLSYDADNEGLAGGNVLPVSSSAGEYGAVSGIPRILDLLDRHRLPASFYIPASSAITHPEMVQAILKSGRHEIALHGWIHEGLARLDNAQEEERLLAQSLAYFERVTGRRPVGFRAPGWAWSRHTLDILRRAKLLYDSSLMGMDEPYEIVANGAPTGLIELPVEWILDDAPYFGPTSALPSPELIFKVYRDEFDVAYREGTMCMLTFHPHVSGRRSRMAHMEKLVEYIKSKPGVWFATAEQIANYLKQSERTQ